MKIPILLYHSVSSHASKGFYPWTVTPEQFAGQMRELAVRGYTPIKVSDFAEILMGKRTWIPQNPVLITFDDGFADFYETALPILKEHHFVATLYVITGFVGGTSQWLSPEEGPDRAMLRWEEIEGLPEEGIEIGAHTQTHPQLDTISLRSARGEILKSKELLETHLGAPVRSFAYPHGYHGPGVRELVIDAGFDSAVAVKHAMSSLQDDRFGLARIVIKRDLSLDDFNSLLAGSHLRVAVKGERLKTVLWRYARKTIKNLKISRSGALPHRGTLPQQQGRLDGKS